VIPGLLERLGGVPRVAGVHLPEEATTAAARVEIDDAAAVAAVLRTVAPGLHALGADHLGGLVGRLDLQGDVVQAGAGCAREEAVEVGVRPIRCQHFPPEPAAPGDLEVGTEVALLVLELAGEPEAEEPLHDRDLRVEFGYSHADVVVPLDTDHVASALVRVAVAMIVRTSVMAPGGHREP